MPVKPWKMPAWMEPYRDLFQNTGGNSIEELMNDKTTDGFINVVRSALIISVDAADYPMRDAVREAFKRVTGKDDVAIFSGWGKRWLERERAVIENRMPAPAAPEEAK